MRTLLSIVLLMTSSVISSVTYAYSDATSALNAPLLAMIELMTGEVALSAVIIAIIFSGYMFLRGRLPLMALIGVVGGCGIILGSAYIGEMFFLG